jgi:hypothetical protein
MNPQNGVPVEAQYVQKKETPSLREEIAASNMRGRTGYVQPVDQAIIKWNEEARQYRARETRSPHGGSYTALDQLRPLY